MLSCLEDTETGFLWKAHMRLGAPLDKDYQDPEQWAQALEALEYRAAYCPVKAGADPLVIRAFADSALKHDIVIAEVGAWSNPLAPDDAERKAALETCLQSLYLADEIGARCCVNISGSRGSVWDGPDPENFSQDTFHLVVETVRTILDQVRPRRSFFTLETMPWMIPDSLDSYEALIRAIDRPGFAVHLDPVNLMSSPRNLLCSGEIIKDAFRRFGSAIRSCHCKDARLCPGFPSHIQECAPGTGILDYPALLACVKDCSPDLPLMLEHLDSQAAYREAADFIRKKERECANHNPALRTNP